MGLGDEEIPSDEGTEPNPDTCNLGTVFLIPDRRLGVCSDRRACFFPKIPQDPGDSSPACHLSLCPKWGRGPRGLLLPKPLFLLYPAGACLSFPTFGETNLRELETSFLH